MKINSPLKRLILFAGIAFALSGLAFYVVSALLSLEKSEQKYAAFITDITTKVTSAQTSYESYRSEGSVNIEKEILSPVNSVKSILQTIYYGKAKDLGFDVSTTEETRTFLKLTIVELEKIAESVNTKTANFNKGITTLNNFSNHVAESHQQYRAATVSLAWVTVVLIFLIGALFSILDYLKIKQLINSASSEHHDLQQEANRVKKLTSFIEAISTGNYSIDLTSGDQDELNGTLITMRDRLKKNAEEDQHRNWTSAGLAQGSEILRINNAQELYDSVIKFVVKYTGSNQGGLFVLTDEEQDKQLELVSCYAYERKKFLSSRVDIGQGMIGQCFLEKQKIHLVEIPTDYVNITSGLGAANPTSLLLVPLKTNDVVYGVLELASFKTYKDFEIEWVEQLAESIASTVASVRASENMRVLLEQTQQQAEEMKSQEEEMRQNMEELSATQEEMSRKEREYINRINDLEGLHKAVS